MLALNFSPLGVIKYGTYSEKHLQKLAFCFKCKQDIPDGKIAHLINSMTKSVKLAHVMINFK